MYFTNLYLVKLSFLIYKRHYKSAVNWAQLHNQVFTLSVNP